MIAVTIAAIAKLKAIQIHHPEDPIVRISVCDLDDSRLSFSITLEANTRPDDDVRAAPHGVARQAVLPARVRTARCRSPVGERVAGSDA